jgi:hypothetical protein
MIDISISFLKASANEFANVLKFIPGRIIKTIVSEIIAITTKKNKEMKIIRFFVKKF